MQSSAKQIIELSHEVDRLDPASKIKYQKMIEEALDHRIWTPLPGPQMAALKSPADIVFFGGAAGGTKSDLLLGLALTEHRRSIIFRREATQTVALVDRLAEIIGTREGFNDQKGIWRLPDRQIEFGSCKDPGDETRWQGRPHDFIGFDEICNFLEHQFRFLTLWLRTTTQGQRTRIVCAGNPPVNPEGRWVITFWGPWIDPKHPHPAKYGELRWYTTGEDGSDIEVPNGDPVMIKGMMVTPLSRTFIPSKVQDNPFYYGTRYQAVLEGSPEPLRSQMLEGNFQAGIRDPEWQVIKTAWIDAAMERWKPDGKKGAMDSMGVDVARGGPDRTVIATRYAAWYSPLIVYPGVETPTGQASAGKVIEAMRDGSPVHIDGIGVGGATVDFLRDNVINVTVVSINSAAAAPEGSVDKATHQYRFVNMRSFMWWRFMESLNPETGAKVALPPDPELKADLCAPLWRLTTRGILIEPKEDSIGHDGVKVSGLKSRLGRSPDKGEAVVYCSLVTPRRPKITDLPPPQKLAHSYAVNVGTGRYPKMRR